MNLPAEKPCPQCRKILPSEFFRTICSGMNGQYYLDSYCKRCRGEYFKAWRAKRRKKAKAMKVVA